MPMLFFQGASLTPDLTPPSIRLWAKGEGWEQPLYHWEATQLSEVTDVIHDAKLGLQQRQRRDTGAPKAEVRGL